MRATARMVGVERNTVARILLRIGERCAALLDAKIRRVPARRVQVDEIWTYIFKKQARITDDDPPEHGDQYVFIGMDADTKLVISHLIGKRDAATAFYLISDLKERLAYRVQLTTDGFRPYLTAVEDAFGADVDYAMLIKMYGTEQREAGAPEWYGPPGLSQPSRHQSPASLTRATFRLPTSSARTSPSECRREGSRD